MTARRKKRPANKTPRKAKAVAKEIMREGAKQVAAATDPAPLLDPRVDAIRRSLAQTGVSLSAMNDALNRIAGNVPIAELREAMEDVEGLLGVIMFGERMTEKQRARFGLIERRRFERLEARVAELQHELRMAQRDARDAVYEYEEKLRYSNEERDRLRRVIYGLDRHHDEALAPNPTRRSRSAASSERLYGD